MPEAHAVAPVRAVWPRRLLLTILALYGLFWLPWLGSLLFNGRAIAFRVEQAPVADTALVFGGLYQIGQPMNEINRERLLAGHKLWKGGKVRTVTVSNTEIAARTMRDFLLAAGMPPDRVALDTGAVATPDTCKYERRVHGPGRRLIYVSHGWHLPRILFLCRKAGLTGTGFAADDPGSRQPTPLHQKLMIRTGRLHREAFFTLTALLGF